MAQIRLPISLLAGLFLTTALSLGACGDDAGGTNCGPGTTPDAGICVPDQDTGQPNTDTGIDTGTPPDTTTGGTDTGGDTGTGTDDTGSVDTFDPNVCAPAEAGQRGMGEPCAKDCQCGTTTDSDGEQYPQYCYDGPYLEGFRFCTPSVGFNRPTTTVEFIYVRGACYEPSFNGYADPVWMPKCLTDEDCAQLFTGYSCGSKAHWGAQAGSAGTECMVGNTAAALGEKKTCIISGLPPYYND